MKKVRLIENIVVLICQLLCLKNYDEDVLAQNKEQKK